MPTVGTITHHDNLNGRPRSNLGFPARPKRVFAGSAEEPELRSLVREAEVYPRPPVFFLEFDMPSDQDVEDKVVDLEKTETDGDVDDGDDEFDDEIVELAANVGVNPDEFDSLSKLEEAVWGAAGKQKQALEGDHKEKTTTDELALEAYRVELNDEDFNPVLRKELQKLSDTQTERFKAVLKDLRAQHAKEIAGLKDQVKYLGRATAARTREADFAKFDKWKAKSDEAKAYFGDADYDDLDRNGKFARRSRALVRRAYRFQETYPEEKPTPSPMKLFDMAYAATPGGKRRRSASSEDADTEKSPTKTARATGASQRSDKKKLTQEERLEKAGKRVDDWQRQRGY